MLTVTLIHLWFLKCGVRYTKWHLFIIRGRKLIITKRRHHHHHHSVHILLWVLPSALGSRVERRLSAALASILSTLANCNVMSFALLFWLHMHITERLVRSLSLTAGRILSIFNYELTADRQIQWVASCHLATTIPWVAGPGRIAAELLRLLALFLLYIHSKHVYRDRLHSSINRMNSKNRPNGIQGADLMLNT